MPFETHCLNIQRRQSSTPVRTTLIWSLQNLLLRNINISKTRPEAKEAIDTGVQGKVKIIGSDGRSGGAAGKIAHTINREWARRELGLRGGRKYFIWVVITSLLPHWSVYIIFWLSGLRLQVEKCNWHLTKWVWEMTFVLYHKFRDQWLPISPPICKPGQLLSQATQPGKYLYFK